MGYGGEGAPGIAALAMRAAQVAALKPLSVMVMVSEEPKQKGYLHLQVAP